MMANSTKWTEGCVVGACLREVETQTGADLVLLAALTGAGTSFGYVVTLVRDRHRRRALARGRPLRRLHRQRGAHRSDARRGRAAHRRRPTSCPTRPRSASRTGATSRPSSRRQSAGAKRHHKKLGTLLTVAGVIVARRRRGAVLPPGPRRLRPRDRCRRRRARARRCGRADVLTPGGSVIGSAHDEGPAWPGAARRLRTTRRPRSSRHRAARRATTSTRCRSQRPPAPRRRHARSVAVPDEQRDRDRRARRRASATSTASASTRRCSRGSPAPLDPTSLPTPGASIDRQAPRSISSTSTTTRRIAARRRRSSRRSSPRARRRWAPTGSPCARTPASASTRHDVRARDHEPRPRRRRRRVARDADFAALIGKRRRLAAIAKARDVYAPLLAWLDEPRR